MKITADTFDRPLTAWIIISAMCYVFFFTITYRCSWHTNPQQFGVVSLKDHYRGWFLSFSDGLVWNDAKQSLSWGVVGADGVPVPGFRLVPAFKHISMPGWSEDLYAAHK